MKGKVCKLPQSEKPQDALYRYALSSSENFLFLDPIFNTAQSYVFMKSIYGSLFGIRFFQNSLSLTLEPSVSLADVSRSNRPCQAQAILEEEYQESFGLGSSDHSESVPSILRKITPPRLSDPPPMSATLNTARHSAYTPHRFASVSTTTMSNGNGIYNEPCDARRLGGGAVKKIPSLRRASLAASIYCDTEHHRQEGFLQPPSPQGESTYFILVVYVDGSYVMKEDN
ncbi:unnamed protein product [Hymenolepis diminuta]|uniref:Longin domain-containing protein n=1 Tax=Hymenolepis diminuta TaxID=6216 RepID=A0A0R3SUH3_HYMDI|nr:unnamed protein product [Hymenolepis diminuta]